MQHSTVYEDSRYYSAFPGMARMDDGRIVMLFRRAPQRVPYSTHLDSHSKAVAVWSDDDGKTWTEPRIVWDESGNIGVQDPSVAVLRDGKLICNTFNWQVVKECPFNHHVTGTFVRSSSDKGFNWSAPVKVAPAAEYGGADYFSVATSEPVIEMPDGELLIPLYNPSAAFLYRSSDQGLTWNAGARIAADPFRGHCFAEPALALLPSGKLLCMLRETNPGFLWQTESTDGGHTWAAPRRTDIWGFPANLLVLSNGVVVCTYGYRRPPFGVRACVSSDEGRTWNLRSEIVIRNEGLHGDLGYPSSIELPDGSVLTAYYFHTGSAGDHNRKGHYAEPKGIRLIACSRYSVSN